MTPQSSTLSHRLARLLYDNTIAGALLPLQGLPPGARRSVAVGYGAVGLLLLVALLLVIAGRILPVVGSGSLVVPLPVLLVVALSLALGWAYVMVGALASHPLVLAAISGLLAGQLLLLLPWNPVALLGFCLLPLGALVVLSARQRLGPFSSAHPLLQTGLLGLLMLLVVGQLFLRLGVGRSVSQLSLAFMPVMLAALAFWFAAGLAVVDFAVDVARSLILWGRATFAPATQRAGALFLILSRPTVGMALGGFLAWRGYDLEESANSLLVGTLVADFFIALALIALLGLLALLRRWHSRALLSVLALSLVSPVANLGALLSLQGRDLSDAVGTTVSESGLIPPLLLFIGLLALSVLSAGAAFASTDGRRIGQVARAHMMLGAALLTLSGALYLSSWGDSSTGQSAFSLSTLEESLFPLGLFLLGGPYLLWILLRRRERLIGPPSSEAAAVPAHGHALLALAVLGALCLNAVVYFVAEHLIARFA